MEECWPDRPISQSTTGAKGVIGTHDANSSFRRRKIASTAAIGGRYFTIVAVELCQVMQTDAYLFHNGVGERNNIPHSLVALQHSTSHTV